jgi:gluconate 2-dehydrogenase subunit 3-like protein
MASKPQLNVLNDSQATKPGMSRREVMQRLFGAAGAGLAVPGVASAHPMHEHLKDSATLAKAAEKAASANWTPEFLDPHQAATLTVLAERIVPGSTKAQVMQFVDQLLSVDTPENQKKFLASLGAFEAQAIQLGHPFKDLSPEQQDAILTQASTAQGGDPEGKADWWFTVPHKESGETPRITLRDHFDNIKGWVSGGYYSSEVGMRELGWTGQVAWASFPGCQHPEGHH